MRILSFRLILYEKQAPASGSSCMRQDCRLTETLSWMNDGPPDKVLYFYDSAGRHVRTVQANHNSTHRDSEASSYDSSGRKTKVHFLTAREPNVTCCYGVEGIEQAYGAPGATTRTVT